MFKNRLFAKWHPWWERILQSASSFHASVRCAVTAGCSMYARWASVIGPFTNIIAVKNSVDLLFKTIMDILWLHATIFLHLIGLCSKFWRYLYCCWARNNRRITGMDALFALEVLKWLHGLDRAVSLVLERCSNEIWKVYNNAGSILSLVLHILFLYGFSKKHAGKWISYSKLPLGVNEFVSLCLVSCEGFVFHSGSTATLMSYFVRLHFSCKGWFLWLVLQYSHTVQPCSWW